MGLHDGMNSDGIMPNTKIAKALGDAMGTSKDAKDAAKDAAKKDSK